MYESQQEKGRNRRSFKRQWDGASLPINACSRFHILLAFCSPFSYSLSSGLSSRDYNLVNFFHSKNKH